MKTTIALILLGAVMVMGHPKGKRSCPEDNYECQCHRLMFPNHRKGSDDSKAQFKEILKLCFNETVSDITPKPGSKRPLKKFFGQVSETVKNCIGSELMKKDGLMSDSGDLNEDSLVTFISDTMNKNMDELKVTEDQVEAITATIGPCAAEAQGEDLKAFAFSQCIESTCQAALEN